VSDVRSAGIAATYDGCRQPGGKNVLRGAAVPVMPGAAARARPLACPEGKLGEHVLLEGSHRLATTAVRPCRCAFYSSWRRNSAHPEPEIARVVSCVKSDRACSPVLTAVL
jgi:hypothetical protein